jgi:hypothetical protein
MRGIGLGGAMVISVLAGGPLAAQAINGGSSGLTQPTRTITFSEFLLPSDTPVFDQWASLGLLVSGSAFYGLGAAPGLPRFPTAAVYNYSVQPSLCCTTMFAMFFTSVLHGAAFNFTSDPSTTLFEAFLNGQSVGQFTASTGANQSLWYGFENLAFDQIQVTVSGPTIGAGFDNLQLASGVSAVPEPATMGLLGTGLAGIGAIGLLARRRRRRSQPD